MNGLTCITGTVSKKCRVMHVKWMSSALSGNLPRAKVQIDAKTEEDLLSEAYRPKRHPGKTTVKTVFVPKAWENAATLAFQSETLSSLKHDAEALSRYLAFRKAPVEQEYLNKKVSAFERQCLEQNLIDRGKYKTVEEVEAAVQKWVSKRVAATTFNWKAMDYTRSKCLSYLLGRSSAEYAVLTQIFNEIKMRTPEFRPVSVLDFGSGTGTVLWAAHDLWGNEIKEYFAVDVSADMNDVARTIAQGGHPDKPTIVKSSFFRQFLPATHTLRYDAVVSAFSLMEMPSMKTRLQTLENLWLKTDQFLVVVETGSNAGYELVAEARDFLLRTSEADVHVFSPCSHDVTCPRLVDTTPCNFQVQYSPMFQHKESIIKTEMYSYVVLRKAKRESEPAWPRIVRPVLARGGHVVCRLCCNDGQLKEVVVTATKHGKMLYKCSRASQWGDLLPTNPVIDLLPTDPVIDQPQHNDH